MRGPRRASGSSSLATLLAEMQRVEVAEALPESLVKAQSCSPVALAVTELGVAVAAHQYGGAGVAAGEVMGLQHVATLSEEPAARADGVSVDAVEVRERTRAAALASRVSAEAFAAHLAAQRLAQDGVGAAIR